MVQTDVPQLARECNEWRERLHSFRDEFNSLKVKLQQSVPKNLSQLQRENLEHIQNQLHIQLINIHDLKQSVKAHEKKIQFEVSENGPPTEETFALHEELYNEYQSLDGTLTDVRNEFNTFIQSL